MFNVQTAFDWIMPFVCICVWVHVQAQVTIHQRINLLKDKNNDWGRTIETTGRLVNSIPKKTIRELDFNIPIMTRDIIH